jgi:hypothetical protein
LPLLFISIGGNVASVSGPPRVTAEPLSSRRNWVPARPTYAKPFQDPARFAALVQEAEAAANVRFSTITLSGWSAGCGVRWRAILLGP